jgi:hypothetical protein
MGLAFGVFFSQLTRRFPSLPSARRFSRRPARAQSWVHWRRIPAKAPAQTSDESQPKRPETEKAQREAREGFSGCRVWGVPKKRKRNRFAIQIFVLRKKRRHALVQSRHAPTGTRARCESEKACFGK